ncbi:MAG: restriction endonuclease subunit S [Kiritimatiellales bacterium]
MSDWQETDFGRIPKDWDLKKVADIKGADKRAIAMGPFGSNIKAENFVEYGVPVIRGTNLNYAKYVGGDFVYLTEEKADDLLGSNCKAGDLVFTHRGTIGQVGLIPSGKFPRYVISQSGMKLTVNPKLMDSDFLFYFFKSEFGQHQILKYESQVGVPSISNPLTSLKEIEVPAPRPAEQKAIAAVLSSLDDKIDLLHRQNKTLEAMAETLFRQWFVEEAGEDWAEVPLEEFFDFMEGPGIRNWQYTEVGTPFINIRLISNGDIDISKASFVSDEEANGKYSHFHLREGDMIVSTSGTLGKNAIVRSYHLPLILNTSVIRFRPRDGRSYSFVYQYLNSRLFQEHLESAASGSVQANFGPTHLKQMTLSKPPRHVLDRYLQQVDGLYEKIRLNQAQIKSLESLRDTLLPKLMSGEVRVRT